MLVSTTWAMREPTNRGTSGRTGSTFSYVYVKTEYKRSNMVAVGLENHNIMALSFETDFRAKEYHLVNGIHIANDIELDKCIFRYTSVEYLLKLLNSSKLYLGSRRNSEDLNEMGWKLDHHLIYPPCPILKNKKEQHKVEKETSEKWTAIYTSCISCWTYDTTPESSYSSENYLMWKNYTGENGIRITSSPSRLANSIQNIENKDIILSNIKYYNKDTHSLLPQDLIFGKRDFYRDERELRLCVLNSTDHLLLDINPETMIEAITFSPFMPLELRKILKEHIENNYKWLNGKVKYSQICTRENL